MASTIAWGESCSVKSQWKYDVFLSFRGKDTRKNFIDHLYTALNQKGIVTYKDDPSLEKGQNISNEVLKGIESSKYLIVIMSREYASSTWCLEELAKIVKCMKGGKQMAIPIFYKVDPSDVRKQTGTFKSAFKRHEVAFKDNICKVRRWKKAMIEIANLAGWDLQDRRESLFIVDIVKDLQNKLGKKLLYAPKNLIGMESRLEDMFLHLSLGSNDVRFIGISGMGGIGKSTLARVIFDEINAQFEGSSFLTNIREVSNSQGLIHLQNKLLFDVLQEKDLIGDVIAGASMIAKRLKHKKVLLVLDDVDQIEHLENLARKSWFGHGSRIIITTRDGHLLQIHHVDVVYMAKELSNAEALELFCLKAFGENNHIEEFANFSKQVIKYAKGFPLALTVLGSLLAGRSMIQWQSILAKLQGSPNKQIFETLRLSFDGLDEKEKAIFLDIACFFNGYDKDFVMEILECCDFHPKIGVEILIERSLLTVIDNKFIVHDLLREMAWEIVRQESPEEPGRRSRLWLRGDLNHVMESNKVTERIEGIILKARETKRIDVDCFHKMTNLRLLVIQDADACLPSNIRYLSNNFKHLSNKLRLLTWDRFPSSYLPTIFLPESLYELNLHNSNLRRLWRGEKIFEKLKHIDMRGSKDLKETPDFTTIPNLEKLILRGCNKLSQIHPSIGRLRNLKFLDLMHCKSLTKLPPSIGSLRSLKVLYLSGCSNLENLPDSICSLKHLEELDISYTAITYLPSNLRNLKNLKKLSCRECRGMQPSLHFLMFLKSRNARVMFLPSLSGLSSLKKLDVSDCHLQEGQIPNDLGCLSSLRYLDLSFNYFVSLPESIYRIPKLKGLVLNYCENLRALPRLPESIHYVRVTGCMKLNSISNLFMICISGEEISFINCLKFLPGVDNIEAPLPQKYSLALLFYIIGCSVFPDPFGKTYIVSPNCEIPKWFTYQEDGTLLSFRIRDQRFRYEVEGFVVCVFLRQEQKHSDTENGKCCYDLICEFNVSGNQVGPSFHFPIRFITSNCLWMSFVSLGLFPDDTNWEEITIDVSLRTLDDQLKVIKCGILPVRKQSPRASRKLMRSASSSPGELSSIIHDVAYPEVDYYFSGSSHNKEREDHHGFPRNARTCGVGFQPFR